jgi:hypothetical protein
MTMRVKGINFDTGFLNGITSTREPFDPEVVRREMRVIRDDLHCTAVRITGGDPNRLFTGGFLPGESLDERLALIAHPLLVRPLIGEVRARMNAFLRRAVDVVRARFGGAVSYASLPLEGVDWAPFDIIATDAAYRTSATAARYAEHIRAFVEQGRGQGKPVAVTEFGCGTHRGAGDLAGVADSTIEWGDDGCAVKLKGEYVRDEAEQATYVCELLAAFDALADRYGR